MLLLISACKPVTEQSNALAQQMPLPQCIESQSRCEINTDYGDFSVKFSQIKLSDTIKTELPFTIELSQRVSKAVQPIIAKELNITKVSAYLEGRDMFMGKIPVFFEMHSNGTKFLAQSLLANCTEEQMVWRLWVKIESTEQEQNFFVDFTSQRL
jgi:hypothetical protein